MAALDGAPFAPKCATVSIEVPLLRWRLRVTVLVKSVHQSGVAMYLADAAGICWFEDLRLARELLVQTPSYRVGVALVG
jgi:hypothetical protein